MADSLLYVFAPKADVSPELARRECYWLVKDQLTDTKQTGWSLSLGQVEPYPPHLDEGVLGHITTENREQLESIIDEFLEGNRGFLLPLSERISEAAFAGRLATIDRIGVIDGLEDATMETVADIGDFWSEADIALPKFQSSEAQRLGAFNIAHPYSVGYIATTTDSSRYSLSTEGLKRTSSDEGPVFTIYSHLDGTSLDALVNKITDLQDMLPTGTGLRVSKHCEAEAEFAMNELDLDTGALSAGSVLVEVDGTDNHDRVAELIERLDRFGLSIAGDYLTDEATFLLFKFHPRHSETNEAGPDFDGAIERRKLGHTEWARSRLPGYKHLDSGTREVTLAKFDQWTISVKRPGRKDADDFTYHLNGPGLDTQAETKPYLHRVFIDVGRHLHCPESGEAFLEALVRLWKAEVQMEECASFVDDLHEELPPCSIADDLWYDRRVLLYALGLQFIVEDLNYRFNFHPRYRAPSYRKQGRDQPMNGLLRVGAMPYDEEAFEELAESTKSGGLIHRPATFEGPPHLRDWYAKLGVETPDQADLEAYD